MGMHVFNPSIQETEACRDLLVHSELQDKQGYGERPCLRKKYSKTKSFLGRIGVKRL